MPTEGQRFGRLVALERLDRTSYRKWKWRCICDCGNETVAMADNLTGGRTTSCGCFRRENSRIINLKDGRCQYKSYSVWYNMMQRCENPNHGMWDHYGGRGINVCDRWKSYENFRIDMGEPAEGMELDRINNDFGYNFDNCRWATRSQQNRNKRNTIWITICGKYLPLADACDLYQLDLVKVANRIYQNNRRKARAPIEAFLMTLEERI